MFNYLQWLGLVTLNISWTSCANSAQFTPEALASMASVPHVHDPNLTDAFKSLSRSTTWTLTHTIPLTFNTFHPQGLALTPTRMFLTSVEILEPTVPYAHPHKNGLDRTPGKGVGHVFVLDRKGNLVKDIKLTDGHKYHPGGIDFDGKHIWVPLAQYRPNSAASIYRLNAETLEVEKIFDADDHYGGLVHDRDAGTLVGNNWGSRNFTEWTLAGKVKRQWSNINWFVDYQDGQYVQGGKMIAGGIANLPQTPSAVTSLGSSAIYELGGVALIDLKSQNVLWEVPVQIWSKAGHVITRNPLKMGVQNGKLTIWVAPDDGSEVGGTQILTYVSNVDV